LENTKKMCDAKFNYSKDVVGKITQFSISQALYDCMTWDRYNLTLGLTLNVPTSLASNSKFVHQLASSVRYHRVNPQRVTVSIVANGPNHKDLPKNLATLNLLGFRLSLNNLGGKSANLSLLGDAKFSEVRLDESITTNIEHSRFNRKMTENLIMFAKSFGLDIVAPNNIYSQRKYTFSKLGVNYIQSNQASHQFTASQISESLSRTQYAS
jgi:EAL domain-containing protein (putative c-di-GMP-specific phosphodiesterase class I)